MKEMLIRVPENEFKALLDRDAVVSFVGSTLRPWTDLVSDVASYGTNLIPRCYNSSGKGLKDIVVLAILLRQVVAMLDGIDLLLSSGAVHAASLQIRALFEASVYIDWILLGDAEKKATYYYVHNLRRRRLWAVRMQTGNPESQKFSEMMSKAGVPLTTQASDSAKEQLREIDRILAQPALAPINADIQKHRRGRFDRPWYVPLGERNLGTMSTKVDKAAIYLFLYSGGSEVMHSSNYEHHVKFGAGGRITFQPIRSVEQFGTAFRFTTLLGISSFRKILQEYRPGELTAFGRKYSEKWQQKFTNFPEIQVTRHTTGL